MSKLGKWLLIFGITALVSAIAFGVSVAVLGVNEGNYGISLLGNKIPFVSFGITPEVVFNDGGTVIRYDHETGTAYEHTFDAAALRDIRIETASAHTTLTCSDTDKVYVKYTAGASKYRFSAEMKNGKLAVEETGVIGILSFGFGPDNSARLEIQLPEKLYNEVSVAVASGRMEADGLTSDKMDISLASGELDMRVYAKDLTYSAASGHGIITNCTENAAEKIDVRTASGGQEISGFKARKTDIDIASGYVTMRGISGEVGADIVSGRVELNYAEWNDKLEIDIMSGKADVTLPAGSGIDLDFDRSSGGMDISLDGKAESFHKDAAGTYGGSNVQEVEIDVASGSVSIHN